MTAGEILGLPRGASPSSLRAAALAELGLAEDATSEAIRGQYRRRAIELHPDRVVATPHTQRNWQRLQAAMSILRPPPERLSEEEAKLWQDTADFAEPFAAGVVEEVGNLLKQWAQRQRLPKAQAAKAPAEAPSLIRSVALDAAEAAVASGQRAVLGRLGNFFERMRNGKS